MEPSLSIVDVIEQIKGIKSNGAPISKKKIKEANPQLMQAALYYFPSWDHALRSVE